MIFEDGDLDGNQALTLAEWERLLEHREIVQYLSVLEAPTSIPPLGATFFFFCYMCICIYSYIHIYVFFVYIKPERR